MSLTKEIAHDLRPIGSQSMDSGTVLPPWAKAIPVIFYLGFAFFLLGSASNTFQQNIQDAKRKELSRVVSQYEAMTKLDQQTLRRLTERRNAAVRMARWVEYTPMTQSILVGLFSGLDDRAQVNSLSIERREGVTPEYAMTMVFTTQQGDVDPLLEKVRNKESEYGWQLITQSQIYQDGVANIQSYLQPSSSSVKYESLYLPILEELPTTTTTPHEEEEMFK
jgi:hypothetical protein